MFSSKISSGKVSGIISISESSINLESEGSLDVFVSNPKLDSKIKAGDIKESELMDEAGNIMKMMKDMPGMKDMGKVMSLASQEMMGKADGKTISSIVKSKLSL